MKLDKCLSAKSKSGLEIFIGTIGRNFDKFPKRGCLIEVVYLFEIVCLMNREKGLFFFVKMSVRFDRVF